MEVRPLAPGDDAEAAGQVVQQAYFCLPDYPRDPEYDALLGEVAVRATQATVLVAVEDGEVLACLTFVPDHTNVHAEFADPEAASFRFFGVSPAAQGRGVGEAMVQWCLDEAARLGRRRLRIHTLTMMHGAQRLYERMAFTRVPDLDEDWDGIIGLAYVRDV